MGVQAVFRITLVMGVLGNPNKTELRITLVMEYMRLDILTAV